METEEIPDPIVIYDKYAKISHPGEYKGGLIIKLQNQIVKMIFSDHVILTENSIDISGLAVGIRNGRGFSSEQNLHLNSFNDIIYIVRLEPEIIKEFDNARFSAIYPNIVRLMHTALLYHKSGYRIIDHLDFVAGEILHRPVAILKNHGLIIGDRLVGDEDMHLVFYDCIIIGGIPYMDEKEKDLDKSDKSIESEQKIQDPRFDEHQLENSDNIPKSASLESNILISYEHFMMFPIEQIETIFLLGTENF